MDKENKLKLGDDEMTDATLKLFKGLVESSSSWNGEPLFEGTKEDRGNLTDLKKRGLVETFTDDGCLWVSFTEAGAEKAVELFDENPNDYKW